MQTHALLKRAGLIIVSLLALTAGGMAVSSPAGGASSHPIALATRPADQPPAATEAVPGELIVGFERGWPMPTRAAAIAASGSTLVRHLRLPGHSLVRVPPGREQEFGARLLATPGVASVEPNLVRHALFEPNDTYYSYQWHFPKIGLPAAWDSSTGSAVTVAVIDTGVAYEDCAPAVCGDDYFEAPDFEGVTFVAPYDFVTDDAHANDENGHGTHVASTIAEATDNTSGAAGIAFDASIMPVRVLDANGEGYVSDVIDGILWAADSGADVINLSLGSPDPTPAEEAAVDYAVAQGALVVAAAGNSSSSTLYCPACYPNAIAVGATRFDDSLAYYSNYGTGTGGHTLDLVAPGGDIFVDQNADGYSDGVLQQTFVHFCDPFAPVNYSLFALCFAQGTSMASPHVAGVAALVRAANPALTPQDVRDILTGSAFDLGPPGYDLQYGHGRLDAAAAVAAALASPPTPTPTATPTDTPTAALTPTPTATPTAEPGIDSDSDGCTDAQELGPDPSLGGLRDPSNLWDFFDTPDLASSRDKDITGADLFRVLARFGTEGDPLLDPFSPPPATGYHPAYDRGALVGPNPWNLGPADGTVTAADIFAIIAQFGHSCAQ